MVRASLYSTIPLERGSHKPHASISSPVDYSGTATSGDVGPLGLALSLAMGDSQAGERDTTCSAFREAAIKGKPEVLKTILSSLPDDIARGQLLQQRDKLGRTALHLAALNSGSAETVQVLLDAAPNAESREKLLWQTDEDDKSTPLHLACLNSSVEAAEVLLKAMPNDQAREKILHKRDSHQQTPLHLAATAREGEEVVKLLLTSLPNPKACRQLIFVSDEAVGTALTSAAAGDASETIRRLWSAMPTRESTFELWNHSCQADKTPLHCACAAGCCAETVQALLDMLPTAAARAKAVRQEDFDRDTPLHLAGSGGVTEKALELLLNTLPTPEEREDALHALNGCAQTPLALAALNGHSKLCKLMSRYARLTCQDVATALWQDGPGGFMVTDALAEEVHQLKDASARPFLPVMYISPEARVVSGVKRMGHVCLDEDEQDLEAPSWLRFFIHHFGETLGHQRVHCRAHMVPLKLLETPDVVGALADTPNRAALDTMFARLAVAYWWKRTKNAYYFNIFLILARLLIVCCLTAEMRQTGYLPGLQRLWLIIPEAMAARDVTNEMAQCGFVVVRWQESMVHRKKSWLRKTLLGIWTYLSDFSNINDFIQTMLGFYAMYWMWTAPQTEKEPEAVFKRNAEDLKPRAFVAIWTALLWVAVLQELRGIRSIGLRLLPILKAVQDVGGFALTLGFSLAAAVHAYFILALQEDVPGSYFYASFLPVWRLTLLGDFDITQLEGGPGPDGTARPDYQLAHVFFFIISTCITVVLMNIFIGVLSSNFDKYAEMSDALLLRARAEIITDFQTKLLPLVARKCKRLCRLGGAKEEVEEDDCLVIFTMAEEEEQDEMREELQSLRTELDALASQTRSDLDGLKRDMQEVKEEVRNGMAELMALLKSKPQLEPQLESSQPWQDMEEVDVEVDIS